jgi:hypothetical protein
VHPACNPSSPPPVILPRSGVQSTPSPLLDRLARHARPVLPVLHESSSAFRPAQPSRPRKLLNPCSAVPMSGRSGVFSIVPRAISISFDGAFHVRHDHSRPRVLLYDWISHFPLTPHGHYGKLCSTREETLAEFFRGRLTAEQLTRDIKGCLTAPRGIAESPASPDPPGPSETETEHAPSLPVRSASSARELCRTARGCLEVSARLRWRHRVPQ